MFDPTQAPAPTRLPSQSDRRPSVQVVVAHPLLSRIISELLEEVHGCRVVDSDVEIVIDDGTGEGQVQEPDVLVIDERTYLERPLSVSGPPVIVIGADNDPGYRAAALRCGADAWLSHDRLADDLGSELRRLLTRRRSP